MITTKLFEEWTMKFAWLPTKTENGSWVWLGNYMARKS